MEYNLLRLRNNLDKYISVDLTYTFSEEQLKGTDLLELKDVKIIGEIYKDSLDELNLIANVKGIFKIPCAVTLKPVDYPFDIKIEGTIDELMGENEEFVKKDENTLDIFPIIWENILMEIPMRVISEGAEDQISNLEGNGWKVITDKEEDIINPALAKLKDLL